MSRKLPLLTATTVVVLGLSPGAALGDEGPAPGAPGIGDPYFPLDGNGGYDVLHYDLDLRYDPATDVLDGVATITARALQDLSAFNLDLQGMEVRSVRVGSAEATWVREGGELTITPARALPAGQRFAATVTYDGVPGTITDALGTSGFMHTDDGAVVAGQPDGAATWFPANDHPRDAASVDVRATVPEGLEAVSNGVLGGSRTADGWTTWEWRAQEPMATYLVTLAIGEFELREHRADGIRFWDALDPDLFTLDLDPEAEGPSAGEVAEASLARQPEIIGFLSEFFGRPYPFRPAGGIVDDHPEFQFALETQTRSIYAPVFFTDPVSGDLVVVHELAHQWIGDLVRIDEWRHIWLNEGFATYAEWLWLEREGLSTPQQEFDAIAAGAPPEFWDLTIGDPGPATEDLFDIAVYYRGAMTLHALRGAVGDDAFTSIVQRWVASQAGGTATTEEFVALAEEVSGQQLDELFELWLSTPGNPTAAG
ncbi:M1 family metallopeptidase [Blastococcus sp. MG754426]|uniref:M1 family metallopeptidase n=1 Tax=unclassified Blastococcus TaxID=2619396 RepID=UPI001EF15DC3|nr:MULTISPECIES: M1 family metallopeptidase [unclassified Blastococcus]MCF6507352.1 M1 family metallopeptidase [Blastococcus sp. MG754426]MCF6511424.1 M1 family metallopeptidase [Blastococcus sp. MG754427]MCF6736281.1 M1 family metallopeptidase [Blastococcus sp. KM273129]